MQPSLNTVVHNEAHRILSFLEHCATYCDELVVIDQSSTDGTSDLARDFGATVITDKCHGIPEPSRPLAAQYTKNEWILLLDADEAILPTRVEQLVGLGAEWDGANLARINYIDGELFTTSPDYQLRYFRKGTLVYGAGLHCRNTMKPVKALFRTRPNDPWILHTKTSVEQSLDTANYAHLMEMART